MILRRVIAHFRKQEWTAILIDLVIVIAGVFIANQVTVWKDEAALSKRKAAAIERLHGESEAIVRYVGDRVAMFEKNSALAAEAMRRLVADDWRGTDAATVAQGFDSFGLAPAAAPPRSVYDELISAGLFAEIGDAELRLAVSDYYAYLAFLQAQIDYARQGVIAESAQRRFQGLKRTYDSAAFRSNRLEYDVEALSADAGFIDYAIVMNEAQLAQQQWWSLLLAKAAAMCAEISRFDGRPCAPKEEERSDEMPGAAAPAANEQAKRP